jgi:vesicle-associated membrane protein 2
MRMFISPREPTDSTRDYACSVPYHFSLERDSKLSVLEERADALQDGSKQFETRAASMKNKFFMENLKSMIMMGIVGLILVGVVYWQFLAQPAQPQYYMPPPQMPPPAAPAPAVAAPANTSDGGEE